MGLFAEKDNVTATCNTCGVDVKRPTCNTSNLTMHLKRHHLAEHQQVLRREQEKKDEEARENETLKRKQLTLMATYLK